MARHEVIIHENTSKTKTVAPYLGNYIAKETLAMAAFASAIGAKCGLPAIQVLAILGGSFEALEALEREGLVRIHTDIGVICAVIKGSFPTADAAFDPERNTLELALRLDDAIQLDLADLVPQGEVPARGRSRAARPDERRQVQGDVLQGRRQRDGLHVRSRLDAGGQRSLRRRRAGWRVGV